MGIKLERLSLGIVSISIKLKMCRLLISRVKRIITSVQTSQTLRNRINASNVIVLLIELNGWTCTKCIL